MAALGAAISPLSDHYWRLAAIEPNLSKWVESTHSRQPAEGQRPKSRFLARGRCPELWVLHGEFLQIAARVTAHCIPLQTAKRGYFWGYISETAAQRVAEKRHPTHHSIPSLGIAFRLHEILSCAKCRRAHWAARSTLGQ